MIIAINWRPFPRNTLVGFVDLQLEPSGILLHDCTFHRHGDGREWIGLPGKPQLDTDGRQRKDPATGKVLYVPVVELTPAARKRFQQAAVAAVHQLLDGTPRSIPEPATRREPPQRRRKPYRQSSNVAPRHYAHDETADLPADNVIDLFRGPVA